MQPNNPILIKMYNFPTPHPKDMIEETLYNIYPAIELHMEFYIDILQRLTIWEA